MTAKVIQEIGERIDRKCREYLTLDGQRFRGISWAEVSRILTEYGYKDKIPFKPNEP